MNSSVSSSKYAVGSAGGQARVLLVLDRPVLVELIKLTLNHGVCTTRAVTIAAEVETTVAKWQPHLVILDMDLDGAQISSLVSPKAPSSGRLPIIGLTRRGDLKAKLTAFEAGVDDILTVPFAPEELLARVIALLRRSYSEAVTFTPVIKIGELEIDILKRTVYTRDLGAAPDQPRAEPAVPAGRQRWTRRQRIEPWSCT